MLFPRSLVSIFYRTSTYHRVVKVLLVLAYLVGLLLFFGMFVNDEGENSYAAADGARSRSRAGLGGGGEGVWVDEDNILHISKETREEALSGPVGAANAGKRVIEEAVQKGAVKGLTLEPD